MKAKRTTVLTLAVTAALAAGCASVPERHVALEAAQKKVDNARRSPLANEHAPVALQEAQAHLDSAAQIWDDSEAYDLVTHHAYLAARDADRALTLGELGETRAAIDDASEIRDEIRLQAREREIDRMENRVERKAAEAERERRRAEAAIEQAQTLASRLAELEAKQTERGVVLTLDDVLFDLDKAELKPGATRTIREIAAFLEDYPDRNVMIEGFTDATGSADYNSDLSERRANAVRTALVEEGINPQRIVVRGYGEDYPVASNATPAGRQLNRRVEIVISDANGAIPSRSS